MYPVARGGLKKRMVRKLTLCFLPLAAVLLAATADSAWRDKPVSQWDANDAKQVLTASPWVKYATTQWLRDMSPGERREGGDWDEATGRGVGIAGTGVLGPTRAAEAVKYAHMKPMPPTVMIRWESALPIRAAEKKAGDTGAPALNTDDYAIVIYNIPTPKRWNLAHELRGIAALKRDKKKDIRPSRVEILRHDDEDDDTATLVYLFPRSVEITKRDGRLEFDAQVGRLFVSQYFNTAEMQLGGEPQLLMPTEGLHN
jgi:hypothetical protein